MDLPIQVWVSGYLTLALSSFSLLTLIISTEPPFDRHDWFVSRQVNGERKEVRYVIDYYSGEPEPTGEPVFYLDVRPAATPLGTAERIIRWGSDVWWKAIGGDKREQDPQPLVRFPFKG